MFRWTWKMFNFGPYFASFYGKKLKVRRTRKWTGFEPQISRRWKRANVLFNMCIYSVNSAQIKWPSRDTRYFKKCFLSLNPPGHGSVERGCLLTSTVKRSPIYYWSENNRPRTSFFAFKWDLYWCWKDDYKRK